MPESHWLSRTADVLKTKTGKLVALCLVAYAAIRFDLIPAEYIEPLKVSLGAGLLLALRAAIGKAEPGKATKAPLILLAVALSLSAVACETPAAKQAANEAHRHQRYVQMFEDGHVPIRLEDGSLATSTLTLDHARRMVTAGAKAWEAQAYYLGSGERPTWLKEEGEE